MKRINVLTYFTEHPPKLRQVTDGQAAKRMEGRGLFKRPANMAMAARAGHP